MENLKERKELASKISLISKRLGVVKADGVNKQEKFSYSFISYEQVEGKLRDLEEEVGVQIYPEIVSFEEQGIEAPGGKKAIRTIMIMIFYVTDTKTGWEQSFKWAGADQDWGGKSFGQTITECCKRFKMKLYKVSSKGEADPDGKTVEGNLKPSSQKQHPAPQKKREKPDDEIWTKLKEDFDVVGSTAYQLGKKECGLKTNPCTLEEGKALHMAIEKIANA